MATRLFTLAFLALLASSCAGYRLGGSKPSRLASVHSIHVAMVDNSTQVPRAAAHATNALVDALTRDGTYRLATAATADAHLHATLSRIEYRQARSARRDTLRSEELRMTVTIEWSLLDASDPSRVLARDRSSGRTLFFVDPNLQTARQNALPDALQRAAESIVARLADGF